MGKFSNNSRTNWELSLLNERLPKISCYKKARITGGLLKKGICNDIIFQDNGGLSTEEYTYFRNKLSVRRQVAQEILKNVPDDALSGRNPLHGLTEIKSQVLNNKKLLVLLADFEDRPHKTDPNYFKNLLFSKGNNFSMRDYFWEVSGSRLNIQGKIIDWQTLDSYQNYLKYFGLAGERWEGPDSPNILMDTLRMASENGFFSNLDLESFDDLIVVVAGEGSNRTLNSTDVSPHRALLQNGFKIGGKLWDSYIILNELPEYDLGGFCHEFAHSLGIPDLYMDDGSSMVVGKWCLMGAGSYNDDGRKPAHLSAWCKMKLGWDHTLKVQGSPRLYEIPAVTNDNLIYKIEVKNSHGKEYFLVENRQQTGFDSYIPYNGILIWHVDENRFIKGSPNFDYNHFALTIEQSDNKRELEKIITSSNFFEMISGKLGGDGGDVFPGMFNNRRFNINSKPNSNSYSGTSSNVIIDSISDSSNVMTAVMGYETDEQLANKIESFDDDLSLTSVNGNKDYPPVNDRKIKEMRIMWYILN